MQKDALYEESAQPHNASKQSKCYTAFNVLFIVFAVLAVFEIFLCLLILPYALEGVTGWTLAVNIIVWVLPGLGFGLASFLFFWFRGRFNVSYDYLFVQDELRITKVFGGKKRKHIVTLTADHILQLGYCEGTSFERTYAGLKGDKPQIMTPNNEPAEGKDFIHILYSSSAGKTLYILECRKEMLEHLVLAAGRNKFVRE